MSYSTSAVGMLAALQILPTHRTINPVMRFIMHLPTAATFAVGWHRQAQLGDGSHACDAAIAKTFGLDPATQPKPSLRSG
jgi:hypothetical protein